MEYCWFINYYRTWKMLTCVNRKFSVQHALNFLCKHLYFLCNLQTIESDFPTLICEIMFPCLRRPSHFMSVGFSHVCLTIHFESFRLLNHILSLKYRKILYPVRDIDLYYWCRYSPNRAFCEPQMQSWTILEK